MTLAGRRFALLGGVLGALAALLSLPEARDETCLPPFVPRLHRPATYLYGVCVDPDGKHNRFPAAMTWRPPRRPAAWSPPASRRRTTTASPWRRWTSSASATSW